jgi:glycosyltransferase involved in cell wall biosynthesis
MPPTRSGIAAYSAEILPILRARKHEVEVFIDRTPATRDAHVFSAHDYVWKRRRNPYDVTVFHLGNATCHDYMWAYLFRFAGMVVLHDAQLHQARALSLTKTQYRKDDYLEEFHANHPAMPPDAGLMVLQRMMGGALYQMWPLIKLVVESARLTVVHNGRVRDMVARDHPHAAVDYIEMGVADPGRIEPAPHDDIVVTAFGGVTPEKRLGPIIRAIAKARRRHPALRLVIVGAPSTDLDVMEEAARAGIADRVHVTGYVNDEEVPRYLAEADICACLRWPTNRETSASWLRCLAAGKPTLITELSHLVDVPTLNPQTWRPRIAITKDPVAASIDLLDEEQSIRMALERLAGDHEMRARLGNAARAWWDTHHRLDTMADHYERVLARAASLPAPRVALPRHLTGDGTATAQELADVMGVTRTVTELFDGR